MSTQGFETVTVAAAAIGFTSATFGRAYKALVTVETAQVRFRTDGTDPTAAIGHVLDAGDTLELDSSDELQKIKFIRTGSTSATLRVTFEV